MDYYRFPLKDHDVIVLYGNRNLFREILGFTDKMLNDLTWMKTSAGRSADIYCDRKHRRKERALTATHAIRINEKRGRL